MHPSSPDYRPISDLSIELNRAASELGALCLIAADESGGVIEASKTSIAFDLHTLAALGTANLISFMQVLTLAQASFPETETIIGIVEGEQIRLIVAGRKSGPIFIALIGTRSPLGLARLEMRALADINWEAPTHSLNQDRLPIDQQLASRDLSDQLFADGGDEKQ